MVDRAIGDALVKLLITNYQWLSHLNSDHDNHAKVIDFDVMENIVWKEKLLLDIPSMKGTL